MKNELDTVLQALMLAKIAADKIDISERRPHHRTYLQTQITSLIGYVEGWAELEKVSEAKQRKISA